MLTIICNHTKVHDENCSFYVTSSFLTILVHPYIHVVSSRVLARCLIYANIVVTLITHYHVVCLDDVDSSIFEEEGYPTHVQSISELSWCSETIISSSQRAVRGPRSRWERRAVSHCQEILHKTIFECISLLSDWVRHVPKYNSLIMRILL